MKPIMPGIASRRGLGLQARERLLDGVGEPLFYADWLRPVFIHYEVDPGALQSDIPFELDLYEGRAHVSLVAFVMRGLRPRLGGNVARWLFKPIATHDLLNVRTYVRHQDEPGIYFIREFIPNRLSELIGPLTYGLPYRHGRLEYDHRFEGGLIAGNVRAGGLGFRYRSERLTMEELRECEAGSLNEFLMERYTAFTQFAGLKRRFRIWHEPWKQAEIEVRVEEDALVTRSFGWLRGAKVAGANFSPGVESVWMGLPRFVGL